MVCARCGTENPERAKFCLECAAPLEQQRREREVRKTVTVVFCDITGSTALGESVDPETLRALLARYYDRMKSIVERHGGTVEKFVGDAVMAVFGVPVLHEDDAVRALRAAAEMRAALPELGVDARIGVNSGEVVTASGEALVTGDAVNVAARLEQAAPPGEVYVGGETVALAHGRVEVAPVEPLALKGKSKRVAAFRLISVAGGEAPRPQRAGFVGRDREQLLLRQAFDLAVSGRVCHLFTLLGVAGVGKSRLAAEFLRDADATIVTGRCLSYGDGITFWPVVEVVKQLRPEERLLDARVSGPLASLLGEQAPPSSKEEIAYAVRRLLEEAARERPLVVVWDDLQWGEDAFLDLVEGVADWARDAPILLLCMARPELLDRRAGWAGGKLHAATVLLEPLDRARSQELLADLAPDLDTTLRERILASAGGNPLFVEEMTAMVAASPDAEVVVPPTIQALLAARLEQLPEGERVVLERGAVEGQVFHLSALEALAPATEQVAPRLQGLVRKELVRPDVPLLPGDEAYRFRHILIRDAAYDALPKATRVELHERFAVWLDEHAGSLVELDEILGYHLEQAARYLRELGADPARASALGGSAAARLRTAGLAALEREDARAATALLKRAAALLEGEAGEPVVLAELAEAYLETDDFPKALAVAESLFDSADVRAAVSARLTALWVRQQTEPAFAVEHGLSELDDLIAQTASGDGQLLARILLLYERFLFYLGRTREALETARRSAELAARCDDRRTERRALVARVAAETHGPAPVAGAIATCRGALERLTQPWSRSFVCQKLAVLEAEAGRFEAARAAYQEAKQLAVDYGLRLRRGVQSQEAGHIELLAGDPAAAERELREGYAILAALGDTGFRATVAALLAVALLGQDRSDEALAAVEDALALAQSDDVDAIARARAVEALAASRQGRHEAARAAGHAAVAAVESSDYLELQGFALLALARVQAAAGDEADAAETAAQALQRYAQKGHVPGAAEARTLLDELAISTR